jgi:hypothetical protein
MPTPDDFPAYSLRELHGIVRDIQARIARFEKLKRP